LAPSHDKPEGISVLQQRNADLIPGRDDIWVPLVSWMILTPPQFRKTIVSASESGASKTKKRYKRQTGESAWE
jgi:hypothetical protein